MNVLFLDAYYEPEKIAYTHLENDLIRGLIHDGHKVRIICPTPTRGITDDVRKKYKKIKHEEQFDGAVSITRFSAPAEGRNPIKRALRYFWCNLRTYQLAKRNIDIDVVFSNSTPPTQGLLGGLVAKKLSKKKDCKIPFLYNLQDIFPDSLVNSNMTSVGSLIWKIGRKIEKMTYDNADRIIVISQGFKRNIMSKGVQEEKIETISNWIDLDAVHPVERKDNRLISELWLDPNKYIVVYAGNFGAAQGADIVVKVARELKDYKDIQFVIFGGGAYFNDAKEEAKDLDNVSIHPLLSQERVSEVYSLGDVALITCKKGTGKAGMPSKTWSIMACNTPIIASFDVESDLSDIIRDSGAGMCVEPENTSVLIDGILGMYEQRYDDTLWINREYAHQNASKTMCVNKYLQVINEVTNNNGK